MMFCKSYILSLLYLISKLNGVLSDCGFPALPVHMKVRPFASSYFEGENVEYYCEYNDMNMIGKSERVCKNSKWTGDIPQCVRELPRRYLDRIEMIDIKNHTITQSQMYYNSNLMKDSEKYQLMTFYGNYEQSSNECIHSKLKSSVQSHEWRLFFKYPIAQIYTVDVVVHKESVDSRVDLHRSEAVISGVVVSEHRECKPLPVTVVDKSQKLFKYSFICTIKDLDINRNPDDMMSLRLESLVNISITFAVNQLTVCEVHVSETLPFRSYTSGSCGSPDIALFSNYTPIIDEQTLSPVPVGYRFACDEGFQLDGSADVLCGVENKWMDAFPTCKPTHSCPMITKDRLKELGLIVNYRKLYSFDGNISAIVGTQAIYSCNKEERNKINVTLIGDSIRFCQLSGNWSGEEPACLEENDFTFYLAELNENILEWDSKLPKFAEHQHRPNECHMPAIPKYAKVFTYDQDLLSVYMASIKERLDLMAVYPNGSDITYNCESKFSYMASDFEGRTCVNGSWVGRIGKCYTPTGGRDVSRVVAVQEIITDQTYPSYYHPMTEDKSDQYWSYIEKEYDNCTNLDINKTETKEFKWNIFLSVPLRISYFSIRFGNKNMFHDLETEMLKVHRADQLTRPSPISANTQSYNYYSPTVECEVTKVIEVGYYGDFEGITQVSFRCDESDQGQGATDSTTIRNKRLSIVNNYLEQKSSTLTIKIKPQLFHQNFNSTNIRFCGIMFFEASDDCGLPEQVANADIISDQNNGYVRYRCKSGYKLVGNEYVRCSKLGHWIDQFPKCELYPLCDKKTLNPREILQKKYYNTIVIGGQESVVLGTIVQFSCRSESIAKGVHVMIGPRTAVCTETGQWSTDEPICADDKYFQTFNSDDLLEHRNPPLIYPLITFVIIISIIVVISLSVVCRHYGFSNPMLSLMTRRRPTRQSSTFIRYGQSDLRNSTVSFNDGFDASINGQSNA